MKDKFNNSYFKLGITIFVWGGALILFYLCVNNLQSISNALALIGDILSPFIIGLIMAFLLCPIYNWTVKQIYRLTNQKFKKKSNAFKLSKVLATIIAMAILIGGIGALLWGAVPEVVRSIVGIIQVLPERMNALTDWIQININKYPSLTNSLDSTITSLTDNIIKWAENKFIPGAGALVSGLSQGIIGTFTVIFNFLIGLVVCVYVLNSKDKFKAQLKKGILALAKPNKAKEIFEFFKFTNRTFGKFINGKILDSIIIGIICFIAMTILNLPFLILISIIIGVTNIIPFFGPFIGAIPSIIIIFLVNPVQALYFMVMVFLLQQLDGNVIGPKILGGATGLASFWVMFAIIVGGGLFGFFGMVLGVPIFAVIYYYVGKLIKKKLAEKQFPEDTIEYEDFSKYGINKEEIL